jgi:membrane-associated protease RseP (regulator of RpoE activity)
MRSLMAFVLAGLALGFAAALLLPEDAGRDAPLVPEDLGVSVGGTPPSSSGKRIARVTSPTPAAVPESAPEVAPSDPDGDLPPDYMPQKGALHGAQETLAQLLAAGFDRAKAEQIVRREAELRREAAYAEFEASGTVRALSPTARLARTSKLRDELGEADYERYLEATHRATQIVVGTLAPDSAAAQAGLVPGDRIVAYAGEPVHSARELTALMLAGTPGELVPVTVIRDGASIDLYLTRGPLGVGLAAR